MGFHKLTSMDVREWINRERNLTLAQMIDERRVLETANAVIDQGDVKVD